MRLLAIVVATVFAHAAYNGSRVTISLYALSLGASPLIVGVCISLYAALPLFLAVATGQLIDRIGVRRPLLLSAAALALAVALPGIAPGLATLFFAAAGIGTAFMAYHIAAQHLVGDIGSAEQRQANFAWLALGFSISNFVGPTFAGFAIDALGHRATFLLLALFALVALGIINANRERLRHTTHERSLRPRANVRELLAHPELRRVFIVTGLLASAWDLFVFAIPIYGTAIGLSASTIGLILGSFALATFVVRLAMPWLVRHAREWSLITGTLVVSCAAYAMFPFAETVPLLCAIAFVLGLGLGATQPSIMSILYAAAPAGRAGEAMGVRSVVLSASHTALPLAFGGLGAALGMGPLFWAMGACLGAGGWFANRRRRAL